MLMACDLYGTALAQGLITAHIGDLDDLLLEIVMCRTWYVSKKVAPRYV